MPQSAMATASVHDGRVDFLGLTYTSGELDRLHQALGNELTQVEVSYTPSDLRFIVVRHLPTSFVGRLRCTDQIYAAMTTEAMQVALLRRARVRALAQELGTAARPGPAHQDPAPGVPADPPGMPIVQPVRTCGSEDCSMRFHLINTDRVKHQAKRLRRFAAKLGYDLRLTECQNLIARMLGYAHFHELHTCAGSVPPSPGDAFVDDATVAVRRRHEAVLVEAGLDPAHAGAAVDVIRPTAYGELCPPAVDPDHLDLSAFEREWGLRTVDQAFEVETARARPPGQRSGVLGRPWLTIAQDRATRQITGLMSPTEPPSARANTQVIVEVRARRRTLPGSSGTSLGRTGRPPRA